MAIDSNITILLVEDSGSMRKMELKILQSLGFDNVVEAGNGVEAVEVLQGEQPVDLIISDWNMPDMDGYELLKWVRADQRRQAVPFLMATAQVEKKQVAKANEAGVSALVSKPFTPDELQLKMEGVFSADQAHASGQAALRTPVLAEDGKLRLEVAHIQITDHLVLGVAKDQIESGAYTPQNFQLVTQRMPGWNPVQQALEEGTVDAALVLAPIAMDLFAYGVPIKLLLLAHKNGSIMVRNAKGEYSEPGTEFFRDSAFYIPHLLSVHHMLAHEYFGKMGLKAGVAGHEGVNVRFEVVPPIRMPDLLAGSENASGYLVAEPLGSKAVAAGIAQRQFLSGEVWPNHPCCVVVFRREVVERHPEAVQEFLNLLVQSGKLVAAEPARAAEIAVKFLDPEGALGLKAQVLNKVLTEPNGITTDDLLPVKADLDRMQHYMADQMGFGTVVDLDQFLDLSFAEKAVAESCQAADGKKALIVGGFAGQRDSLSQLLAAGGFEAAAAEGLEQAQNELAGGGVELIVADWEAGGLDLLQWLRGQSGISGIPFLMALEEANRAGVLESVKAKANNYLTMPFNPEEVRKKLCMVFS